MKKQDKSAVQAAENEKKKLRIKTSTAQPTMGPDLPCVTFTF